MAPYKTREELPEPVKEHLPAGAQEIYKEAFMKEILQKRARPMGADKKVAGLRDLILTEILIIDKV